MGPQPIISFEIGIVRWTVGDCRQLRTLGLCFRLLEPCVDSGLCKTQVQGIVEQLEPRVGCGVTRGNWNLHCECGTETRGAESVDCNSTWRLMEHSATGTLCDILIY